MCILKLRLLKQIIFIVDDSSSIVDQKETENDNNEVAVGVVRSNHISVESIVEIITKRALDVHDIDDDTESCNLFITDCATSYKVSMLKRYIYGGNLDEK